MFTDFEKVEVTLFGEGFFCPEERWHFSISPGKKRANNYISWGPT
jgi:hypothetical protein